MTSKIWERSLQPLRSPWHRLLNASKAPSSQDLDLDDCEYYLIAQARIETASQRGYPTKSLLLVRQTIVNAVVIAGTAFHSILYK